jgi:hypothetical protein
MVGKGIERLVVRASASRAQSYYYLRVFRTGNAKDEANSWER